MKPLEFDAAYFENTKKLTLKPIRALVFCGRCQVILALLAPGEHRRPRTEYSVSHVDGAGLASTASLHSPNWPSGPRDLGIWKINGYQYVIRAQISTIWMKAFWECRGPFHEIQRPSNLPNSYDVWITVDKIRDDCHDNRAHIEGGPLLFRVVGIVVGGVE